MKDFRGPEGNIEDAGSSVETAVEEQKVPKQAEDPTEVQRKLAREAVAGVSDTAETLESVEPQTEEQKGKAGFLSGIGNRIKGIFGSKSPEYYTGKGMEAIEKHPVKLKMYNKYKTEDPEKAEKYAMAVGKDPDVKYWGRDEKKQDFKQTGSFGVASGEGVSGQ